jgi:hypothetical protein
MTDSSFVHSVIFIALNVLSHGQLHSKIPGPGGPELQAKKYLAKMQSKKEGNFFSPFLPISVSPHPLE